MTTNLSPALGTQYNPAVKWLRDNPKNLFLTGRAGTGKTTLLRQLIEQEAATTIVLAPTGVAAMNIGGQTLHSFFKFPPRLLDTPDIKRMANARIARKMTTLIIDEISMVRADMLQILDETLRLNRADRSPFGGVRVIVSGDLHQLPPVIEADVAPILQEKYGGAWFHKANGFQYGNFHLLALKHVFRQQDDEAFLEILGQLRQGGLEQKNAETLNARVSGQSAVEASDTHIVLTPNNNAAWRINQTRLETLDTREQLFEATIDGQMDEKSYPTDADLRLKIGARIMLIRNDTMGRWVNGSIGYIREFEDDAAIVEVEGDYHRIEAVTWEKFRYDWDRKEGKISRSTIGSFKQLPVRLAYAVTIHKAQGLTMDKVYIDFDRGFFAHGQAYVALSRCRSLDGLELSRALRPNDIHIDRSAFKFGEMDVLEDNDHFLIAKLQAPKLVLEG